MQKVCFSDREKSSELLHLNCDPWVVRQVALETKAQRFP
ncbi:hypothetical protein LEP1GSC082_2203 [Leptospira kirschneri str. H2]|uniref:Uncharacterized protein n=1 Tax=Leptospira kirschneri str. H1 TaxID=1049966 RepID=A0A0E2B021_9LEPT|nr:hypothetical protein LEP1GSC081_3837 [Leptospira kirschneri str. H1]EKO61537.1 hypothetical protein LEP1GSC082_2203 [Leptospira kirschneri str. H2]